MLEIIPETANAYLLLKAGSIYNEHYVHYQLITLFNMLLVVAVTVI